MDNYNEVKEATTNKVRFSINDGRIEFDSEGLKDWEVEAVIDQIASQARQQQQARQKIQEIRFTSELMMHCTAIAFCAVLVFGLSFTISRVVSGLVQQSEVQNVR